jgi:hypothetical protein
MPQPPDLEARMSALETRMEEVAADATAARHLAAAGDRDLADLTVKVDANRAAISALGEQTNAGFADVRSKMRAGFADVRAQLDQTVGGLQLITDLLNTLIAQEGDQ